MTGVSNPKHPAASRPAGLTLTELMVASTLSLVVMGAVASLFGLFGRTVRLSQATVDMSALMRNAAWQLRQDLAGITCQVGPWVRPETGSGYFELLEGPARDASFSLDSAGQPTTRLDADTDDILLFTTQSLAGPFLGRYEGMTIESPYAEVAWFCRPAASQPVAGTTLYELHRRQLLVTSYLGRPELATNSLPVNADRASYDVSFRTDGAAGQGGVLVPNSLADLSKRENRFMRSGYSYLTEDGLVRSTPPQSSPFAFPVDTTTRHALPQAALEDSRRAWENVILTNVIAFDVRVFDARAVPRAAEPVWRHPGEPGYELPNAGTAATETGAYVDLGWGGGSPASLSSTFPPAGQTAFQSAGVKVTAAPLGLVLPEPTYDTWPLHYEFNGIDDDGDGVIDEGGNGADLDGDGWPEHSGDSETSPPYPTPLRGIEVRIRCYEPTSKQVRQMTVRHSFAR